MLNDVESVKDCPQLFRLVCDSYGETHDTWAECSV